MTTCHCGKKCKPEDTKSCCGVKCCQKCLIKHFSEQHRPVEDEEYEEEHDVEDA